MGFIIYVDVHMTTMIGKKGEGSKWTRVVTRFPDFIKWY